MVILVLKLLIELISLYFSNSNLFKSNKSISLFGKSLVS